MQWDKVSPEQGRSTQLAQRSEPKSPATTASILFDYENNREGSNAEIAISFLGLPK